MDLLEYLSIITGSIFEGQFLCRIVRTSLIRVDKNMDLGLLPQTIGGQYIARMARILSVDGRSGCETFIINVK